MQVHIFNPEHDLALAFGGERFTPPHAARELRTNLGFLPALWAENGDVVLVDDVDFAIKAAQKFRHTIADVSFLSFSDLQSSQLLEKLSDFRVLPWGWDAALRNRLKNAGVPKSVLPSIDWIQKIRNTSSRATSVEMLRFLRSYLSGKNLVGESFLCTTMDEVLRWVRSYQRAVVKAPWSSSGRGVRYVENEAITVSMKGWMQNILQQQQALVVEPYYIKERDFALEFEVMTDGSVSYCGLSLFDTVNGGYMGNLLMPENEKRKIMSDYMDNKFFDELTEGISMFLKGLSLDYVGPFGVDMMVVKNQENDTFAIHPCIELNLRRTMGHVALALTSKHDEPPQIMRIIHDVNYRLVVSPLENPFVKVI